MTERPILFSAPMVRAILDGRKTQTRRVCKPIMAWEKQDVREARFWNGGWHEFFIGSDIPYAKLVCRHGRRGDRLWVREKYTLTNHGDPVYYADFKDKRGDYWHSIAVDPKDVKWKSPIFMPRAASRITLEITDIRVERLQDISQTDARAEGCLLPERIGDGDWPEFPMSYKDAYQYLWETISGAGSWDANPWVWVIEFKRVTP